MRNLEFITGEYYHLYNRGIDKRKIFDNPKDYYRFIVLIYLCNGTLKVDIGDYLRQGLTLSELFELDKGEDLVSIGSYCLMPNHFHILVHENKEGGISTFMHKLQTAYTMYYNKKNERTGSLFQGTFKAKHASLDNYLKYLFAYINLNPLKLVNPDWREHINTDSKGLEMHLSTYKYSSYLDLIGVSRIDNKILKLSKFPDYFSSDGLDFKSFIQEWINIKDFDKA